jgi:excisionase family DNA binding protein
MPILDKQSDGDDTYFDKYISISETAKRLGVSERTVYRRIDKGEIKTTELGEKRVVLAESLTDMSQDNALLMQQLEAERDMFRQRVSQLEDELEHEEEKREADSDYWKKRLEEKDKQIEKLQELLAESSHRHDTVVMQLTKIVEYQQQPFWRKLFQRKRLPPPVDEIIMDVESKKRTEGNEPPD